MPDKSVIKIKFDLVIKNRKIKNLEKKPINGGNPANDNIKIVKIKLKILFVLTKLLMCFQFKLIEFLKLNSKINTTIQIRNVLKT
jgi:hypothetical protein